MCGRYTLTAEPAALAEVFELAAVPALPRRYNIAPTQPIPVIRAAANGGRECVEMRWGLIPSWSKDVAPGNRMINARAESVARLPSFRESLLRRRCVVPADGFYEWQKVDRRKQPFYIRLPDGRPFSLAGLWDRWQGPEGPVESCAIITTAANALLEPVHSRMPAILDHDAAALWLDPELRDVPALLALLSPYPAERMVAFPVSMAVNDPKNDAPVCSEPLPF